MININQTLLSKVTDSEAWMLIHMVGAIDDFLPEQYTGDDKYLRSSQNALPL